MLQHFRLSSFASPCCASLCISMLGASDKCARRSDLATLAAVNKNSRREEATRELSTSMPLKIQAWKTVIAFSYPTHLTHLRGQFDKTQFQLVSRLHVPKIPKKEVSKINEQINFKSRSRRRTTTKAPTFPRHNTREDESPTAQQDSSRTPDVCGWNVLAPSLSTTAQRHVRRYNGINPARSVEEQGRQHCTVNTITGGKTRARHVLLKPMGQLSARYSRLDVLAVAAHRSLSMTMKGSDFVEKNGGQ